MAKRISILGSTGSIGKNALDVISHHPDRFEVTALAVGTNIDLLLEQAIRFRPKMVSVATSTLAEKIRLQLPEGIEVGYGDAGLLRAATHEDSDFVITAVVGSRGLGPTLAAIGSGKPIGIANKETLVTAGHLVVQLAKEKGVDLFPIDSEHSAIFQCLNGENVREVNKIILTSSGGSFRDLTREQLLGVTVEDALKHPTWSMGAKITIDSATMMNKGFEVIEAHWLFSIPYDQIEVLIHQESIVHSMVEFDDYSVIAQLGTPDMRVPIQYALTYPNRLKGPTQPLDLSTIAALHFRKMDFDRYPCMRLAFESGRAGGTYPTVLNAANEVAVERFLNRSISFLSIESILSSVLDQHQAISHPSLETIMEADRWAREQASRLN
jgi:1-deoxy-D-xylulose-5-phosphate reductoisomerase